VEETAIDPDSDSDGTGILVTKPVFPGQNVSKQGGDISKGYPVAREGMVLTPARTGLLASLGIETIRVYCRPKVAIIATGGEVTPLGQPLKPGQVYNSNSYTLEALGLQAGAIVDRQDILPDVPEALEEALTNSLKDNDLVVLSGGSSVGERDLLVHVVKKLGQVIFHGVSVRPGKPVLFGLVNGKPVLGLPGYPTSCLTTGYIFLLPTLRRLGHRPPEHPRKLKAKVTRRINSVYGRTQYHTVRLLTNQTNQTNLTDLTDRGDGLPGVEPAFKESGALTSLSGADGFIVIPSNIDMVEAGDVVEVLLL